MKSGPVLLITAALSGVATYLIVSNHMSANHAAQLAQQRALWAAEKAELERALLTRTETPVAVQTLPAPGPQTVVFSKPTPSGTLDRLIRVRIRAGADRSRNIRQAIKLFEDLIEAGEEALPVIGAFLERFEDVEYEAGDIDVLRGLKENRLVTEFVLPPSLRLGLLDVVRRIGGESAEQLLAKTLSSTGRAVEVAYLAKLLQDLAPDRYRDLALSVAHDLLGNPPADVPASRFDKAGRDFLFSVLAMYGDKSFAAVAEDQLVRPTGEIDHSALRYLKNTLGDQALPAVAGALSDARLTSLESKEPLIDFVANYVGLSPQANQLFQMLVKDNSIPIELRVSSLMGLYKLGLDHENPGLRDLQLAQARLEVIETLKPELDNEKLIRNTEKIERAFLDFLSGPGEGRPPKKR